MRVLHLSSFGQVCGIADYAEDLVASQQGVQDVVTQKMPYPAFKPMEKGSYAAAQKAFRPLIEASKDYDVVHVQHEFGFFMAGQTLLKSQKLFGWLLRELGGRQVVVTFHTAPFFQTKITQRNYWQERTRVYRAWQKEVMGNFKKDGRYVCVLHNEFVKELFVESGAAPETVVVRAHAMKILPQTGMDEELASRIKAHLKPQKGDVILSTLGFITPSKGILESLQALSLLPSNYKLLIAGGAPLQTSPGLKYFMAQIERLIKDEGLQERVYITGYLKAAQMRTIHSLADCFLFLYEPYLSSSGAITIALQAGKPIVASSIRAFYDINNASECMEMTFTRPPQAIARKIAALMNDEARKTKMTANMKKYCEANTWKRYGEVMVDVYTQRLNLKKLGAAA